MYAKSMRILLPESRKYVHTFAELAPVSAGVLKPCQTVSRPKEAKASCVMTEGSADTLRQHFLPGMCAKLMCCKNFKAQNLQEGTPEAHRTPTDFIRTCPRTLAEWPSCLQAKGLVAMTKDLAPALAFISYLHPLHSAETSKECRHAQTCRQDLLRYSQEAIAITCKVRLDATERNMIHTLRVLRECS